MQTMYTDNKGRKRRIGGTYRKPSRDLTPKEIQDMTGIGIRHPGSLTKYGYRINNSLQTNKIALDKAITKYGKTEVLRKLAELYRLDYNKPKLRSKISDQIRYVSGGN